MSFRSTFCEAFSRTLCSCDKVNSSTSGLASIVKDVVQGFSSNGWYLHGDPLLPPTSNLCCNHCCYLGVTCKEVADFWLWPVPSWGFFSSIFRSHPPFRSSTPSLIGSVDHALAAVLDSLRLVCPVVLPNIKSTSSIDSIRAQLKRV